MTVAFSKVTATGRKLSISPNHSQHTLSTERRARKTKENHQALSFTAEWSVQSDELDWRRGGGGANQALTPLLPKAKLSTRAIKHCHSLKCFRSSCVITRCNQADNSSRTQRQQKSTHDNKYSQRVVPYGTAADGSGLANLRGWSATLWWWTAL